MPGPLKLTQSVKDKIVGSMAMGASAVMAAQLHGISKASIYNHREKDQEFAKAMDEARAAVDERVVNALLEKAESGDTTACIFWLKNRRSGEWRDRRIHEVTGSEGGPLEYRACLSDGGALPAENAVLPTPGSDE